jgi:tetratricopeptide (TPR) repeat protein
VKWFEAVAAATRARELLDQGEADPALRQQVTDVLAGLLREQATAEKQAAEVERDRKLLAKLEAIRGSRSEHFDPKQTDTEYGAAFRGFGIDLDQLDPEQAGKQIGRRSTPVELASYVDDWAVQRRQSRNNGDEDSWRRLLAAARAADPDPWRVALRDQIGRAGLEALRRLATNERDLAAQPPRSLALLAMALKSRGDQARAEQVLRQAWRVTPDDFWVNFALMSAHWTDFSYDKPEEAIRYASAAVAIRPRSSVARNNLGLALTEQGKLNEAVAEFREAIRLQPGQAEAHTNLGYVFHEQGNLNEAVAAYREAIRVKPDFAGAHTNLGAALREQGALQEAVAECRVAIRLEPRFTGAHNNLGRALWDQGKLNEAEAEWREAIRLKPDYAEARSNLGAALCSQGRSDQAIAECRGAIRLKPDYAEAHCNLGDALAVQGNRQEAIAEYREAIRLEPGRAETHNNLANVLIDQGKADEAVAECREAIRLKPDLPHAHYILGRAVRFRGEFAAAIPELRKARELAWNDPKLAGEVERELEKTKRQATLITRLPALLIGEVKPADPAESLSLAMLCYDRKLHESSARFWAEAFQSQFKLAGDMLLQHRYNAACAAALAGCGQGKDNPPPDEPAKARWRKQAIDWLKANLAAWSKILKEGPPQARQSIPETLQHWKTDPDLAGLRDPEALKRLPETEQKVCRALWAEVDGLLAKARSASKP